MAFTTRYRHAIPDQRRQSGKNDKPNVVWQTIYIGDFMEIRTTFKQTKTRLSVDKFDNKTKHFHDFSIIMAARNCNDDYAQAILQRRIQTKISDATLLTMFHTLH
eukprot:4496756-Amphidinium_carterae.1